MTNFGIFLWNSGGFIGFTVKLQIKVSPLLLLNYGLTKLAHLNIQITSVSIFVTDSWQHCEDVDLDNHESVISSSKNLAIAHSYTFIVSVTMV